MNDGQGERGEGMSHRRSKQMPRHIYFELTLQFLGQLEEGGGKPHATTTNLKNFAVVLNHICVLLAHHAGFAPARNPPRYGNTAFETALVAYV